MYICLQIISMKLKKDTTAPITLRIDKKLKAKLKKKYGRKLATVAVPLLESLCA